MLKPVNPGIHSAVVVTALLGFRPSSGVFLSWSLLIVDNWPNRRLPHLESFDFGYVAMEGVSVIRLILTVLHLICAISLYSSCLCSCVLVLVWRGFAHKILDDESRTPGVRFPSLTFSPFQNST